MTANHKVICHLDAILEERGMTLVELSESVDITVANLSILKNGHARAIRFSTLTGICDALDVQPGDLFTVDPGLTTVPGNDGGTR